jgi:hypothetical protein
MSWLRFRLYNIFFSVYFGLMTKATGLVGW